MRGVLVHLLVPKERVVEGIRLYASGFYVETTTDYDYDVRIRIKGTWMMVGTFYAF